MKADVVIVGAGFAGASTAFHLSRRFGGAIVVVDKEALPGFHASGRNAAMVRQLAEDSDLRRVLVSSRRWYARIQDRIGFDPCGSLLLGKRRHLERLREPALVESAFRRGHEVQREFAVLRDYPFDSALYTPTDGVMDISALLQFYLEGARQRGVRLLLDCQVEGIGFEDGIRLETSRGTLRTRFLVNAAGAWAGLLGQMAGATAMPLQPLKRHLFILKGFSNGPPRRTFGWSLQDGFYLRRESGGLLFSLCDEEPGGILEPTVTPGITETLAEFVWRHLPALRNAVPARVWSCFRTRTSDDRFLIGWDPRLENFFWVAGLGGHGMAASWEVGRLAAERFAQRGEAGRSPFDPARFCDASGRRSVRSGPGSSHRTESSRSGSCSTD